MQSNPIQSNQIKSTQINPIHNPDCWILAPAPGLTKIYNFLFMISATLGPGGLWAQIAGFRPPPPALLQYTIFL